MQNLKAKVYCNRISSALWSIRSAVEASLPQEDREEFNHMDPSPEAQEAIDAALATYRIQPDEGPSLSFADAEEAHFLLNKHVATGADLDVLQRLAMEHVSEALGCSKPVLTIAKVDAEFSPVRLSYQGSRKAFLKELRVGISAASSSHYFTTESPEVTVVVEPEPGQDHPAPDDDSLSLKTCLVKGRVIFTANLADEEKLSLTEVLSRLQVALAHPMLPTLRKPFELVRVLNKTLG